MKRIVLTFIVAKFLSIFTIAQNVGIGTSTPTTPLEIANSANLPTTLLIHSGNTQFANGIVVNPSTHTNSRRSAVWLDNWGIMQDAAGSGTKDFGIYQGNPGAWRLYINTAGNVGIGTLTPGATLNVIHPTANTTPTKPSGNWAAIIENNQDGNDGRHGLSVAARWGGAETKIFEAASYWSGAAQAYTPALTVLGNRNVGIGTDNPKSKLHTIGGISLGAPAVGTGINEVWGARNSIQLISTVGEACTDHTGALMYTTMACAWGAATLNIAISNDWGSYNTTNLAMKIGQNLTTFNNEIRAGSLANSGNVPVYANNDGTLYKGTSVGYSSIFAVNGSGTTTVTTNAPAGYDTNNSFCFLTNVSGKWRDAWGGGERCTITNSGTTWQLVYGSGQSAFNAYCEARCFRFK